MLQGPEGVNGMRSNVVEGQEETIGFWTHGQCPRTPFVPYLSGKLCRRPVARVPTPAPQVPIWACGTPIHVARKNGGEYLRYGNRDVQHATRGLDRDEQTPFYEGYE